MKPVSCWRQSTAGSPRALTPPICRRPRHCSKRWERSRYDLLRCAQTDAGAPPTVWTGVVPIDDGGASINGGGGLSVGDQGGKALGFVRGLGVTAVQGMR